MLDTTDRTFLKSCKFSPENPYCPIFRLGSVVSWTGSSFQEIAVQVGGMRSGALPRAEGCGLGLCNEERRGWRTTGGSRPCSNLPRDLLSQHWL